MPGVDRPQAPPPPCPTCQSTNTIKTADNFGEEIYFCPDCEHSWSQRSGKTPRPPKFARVV